jgi:alpha-tubulin suppressor-like RCC1 family protein
MIKTRRKILLISTVVCVLLICFLFPQSNIYHTLKFKKSKIVNLGSEFKALNGELYEITPDGNFYLHTFISKADKVTAPDITYQYDYDFSNAQYISQDDMQKAINSDYYSASFDVAYIKDNKLFVQGGNKNGVLGVGHSDPFYCYKQITDITNVKKVSVTKLHCSSTVALTADYLYICSEHNEYSEKEPYKFFKVEHPYKFIDMDSNVYDTIVLDENGEVYNIVYNIEKMIFDKKIKQICSNGMICLALSDDGNTIYIWGEEFDNGKGMNTFQKKLKGFYHADKILAGYNCVYMIDGDTIIKSSYN